MTKTHDEIMADLRKATQAPLGQRTLAGTVRKGIKLLLELRADHSWNELSAAMAEVGYPVSAETLRRTVRRALQTKSSQRSTPPPDPPAAAAAAQAQAPAPAVDTAPSPSATPPSPQARDPPLRTYEEPVPTKRMDSPTLRIGGGLLDDLNKLKDLNR